MKISEKLQKRIKEDLGLEVSIPARIQRGRHQAAAGQWCWSAKLDDGSGETGSEDSMIECINCEVLTSYRPSWPSAPLNICAEEQPKT